MATVIDTVAAQLEIVEPELQNFFEQSRQLSGLIGTEKNIRKISRQLWRLPVKLYQGGNFHKYSANEGSLGVGTGMKLDYLTAGYFYSVRGYRVTREQKDTSDSSDVSVIDVLADTLANAMTEAQVDDDITLHTDGTGRLTEASSGSSANTLTFAGTTDFLGVGRLREGMCVDVWNSAGTTKRAGAGTGPIIITMIDWSAKVVTFNQNVTSIATGDLLAFPNMDVYGPAALTSFASGWPDATVAGGLGGDSFRHGIYYANDATTANYYLGKQRSAMPQLVPTRVNALSSQLSWMHGLLGLDGLIQKRDPDVISGLIGVAHMSQRAAVFELGINISNKQITGDSFGKSVDMLPSNKSYGETFEYCGIMCHLSKRQKRDRIDFINPSVWGRAQLFPARFYEEEGRRTFEGRGASTGEVQSYSEFFIEQCYDFVCKDPGRQFFIDNIALPTGY